MFKSQAFSKLQAPKLPPTHRSHIVNAELPDSNSVAGAESSLKMPYKKKTSGDQPIFQKKLNSLYTFEDQRAKAKSILITYINNVLKASYTEEDTLSDIDSIDKSSNFDQLIQNIIILLSNLFEAEKHRHLRRYIQTQKNKAFEKDVTLSLRTKQAKLLRIVKEEEPNDNADRGKSKRKYQDLISVNQAMKKQIFELREQKLQLERKILEIIDEYKTRKQFYVAQIKKLTDIINMSSFDVRKLVLQRTREANFFENRYEKSKFQDGSAPDIMKTPEGLHFEDQEAVEGPNNIVYNLTDKSRNLDDSRGVYNGYNTEIRMLKGVSSIQNIEEGKYSSSRVLH